MPMSSRASLLQVHPAKGNVAFASAESGWSFTLRSFAQLYMDVHGTYFDVDKFAARLWGDHYYNPATRRFSKNQDGGIQRSFVHFVLEPLYKIYTQVTSMLSSILASLYSSRSQLPQCKSPTFFGVHLASRLAAGTRRA